MPQDWVNAVIVDILKKGDLSFCDNWRGISLLVSFFARILQQRLQRVRGVVRNAVWFQKRQGVHGYDLLYLADG